MHFVFIDPSGSYNEGKGHTGIAIIEDFKWKTLEVYSLSAKDYTDRHLYWKDIIRIATKYPKCYVVIENFVIRNNGFLIGKMPETPLAIGAIIWELEELNVPYEFQTATAVKSRFKDENLGRYIPNFVIKGTDRGNLFYLNGKLTNDHIRDALKHLVYFQKYGGYVYED